MIKHFVAACLAVAAAVSAPAQTLVTYGTDSVSVPQFLQAYQKNNTAGNSAAAMQEYLQLYIASRLKIKEAKERGYDRLPHLQTELASLREQIAPTYLKDEEAAERLVNEALQRAKKDLELSHIFISFTQDGLTNVNAAQQKAEQAFKELQQGKPFAEVARRFSDDPSATTNGGKVGFITAFTLPYELENEAYNTPAKTFSKPFASKRGYHIFKVDSERPARGRMRIGQILLAFPPDADAATEAQLNKKADSLYNRLQKGDDFSLLAARFSDDPASAQAGGQLPEISIGQYDPQFENVVFGLTTDGAVSPPFKTAHGYHIVKRLSHHPITSSEKDMDWLRGKVESSEDRMAATQAALVQKLMKSTGYKKLFTNEAALWAYSDSVLEGKKSTTPLNINASTGLFAIGETETTVSDWIQFAQVARYKSDGSGIKPYAEVWEAFVQSVILEYYKQNLEQYNEAFRNQLTEFAEGSLFFEIMQREVWNKAQEDTAALQQFYTTNKAKYKWDKSADAILFFAPDSATAKALQTAIAKAPAKWRLILNEYTSAVGDSGRYDLAQLPGKTVAALKKGSFTQPALNEGDNSYAFAYILKMYTQPVQRSFAEARSQVATDYQAQLDKQWVESLKQKYNVTIRQSVLQQMLANTTAAN